MDFEELFVKTKELNILTDRIIQEVTAVEKLLQESGVGITFLVQSKDCPNITYGYFRVKDKFIFGAIEDNKNIAFNNLTRRNKIDLYTFLDKIVEGITIETNRLILKGSK